MAHELAAVRVRGPRASVMHCRQKKTVAGSTAAAVKTSKATLRQCHDLAVPNMDEDCGSSVSNRYMSGQLQCTAKTVTSS